ncbi:hypothetical protein ACFWPH_28335 [Nocardia sp. NPDC058499]|uniref:hypothetical protein n=1 Tax=Nocardia sp. NPDC058499 TaxID=3346530 RepID=UPI0036648D32
MASHGFIAVSIFGETAEYHLAQARPAAVIPRLALAWMDMALMRDKPTLAQWADYFDKDRHVLEPRNPADHGKPAHEYRFGFDDESGFRFCYRHLAPGTDDWGTVVDTDSPEILLQEGFNAALAMWNQTKRLRARQGWTADEPIDGIPTVSALGSRVELHYFALELFSRVIDPAHSYTEPVLAPRDEAMSEADYFAAIYDRCETQAMINHDIGALAHQLGDHIGVAEASDRAHGFLVSAYRARAALARL